MEQKEENCEWSERSQESNLSFMNQMSLMSEKRCGIGGENEMTRQAAPLRGKAKGANNIQFH